MEYIGRNVQLTETLGKLKLAQEQLIKQERLASIGQLAAGIAHEINNPLGFISSNTEIAKIYFIKLMEMLAAYDSFIRSIPDTSESIKAGIQQLVLMKNELDIPYIMDDIEKLSNAIEDGLKRITEIITSLKAFSRLNQNNEFEEYDLNNGIKNILIIVKNNIKYHANEKVNLGDIPHIQACGNKIDQVLLNIILNASHAIKERQSIDKQMKEPGLITISTDVKDGFVRCIISDNGIGIEKNNISKIFDPFYTTKPQGEGTGLGLSIGYDIIVNQHNGYIHVKSTPMVGTMFIIMLPVVRS
jgi:two-component system NtrC family sensor kinase